MQVIQTILPVVTLLGLGILSRLMGWVTVEQKDGAKHIVFSILFPILIFNVLFTSSFQANALFVIVYIFVCFVIAFIIGKALSSWTGKDYEMVSPFLLTTVEGGNVILPLYITLVGSAYISNTVMFDMAGVLMAFILTPILVSIWSDGSTDVKGIIQKILSNSFIIAVGLGLILKTIGIYDLLVHTNLMDMYTDTINALTTPITGMILFCLGYELKIEKDTIQPLLKLIIVRFVIYVCVILGFFVLFKDLMLQREFKIAVLLYFMGPTGFALPMQLMPLFKKDEESYASAFISLYSLLTLIVYVLIVIFVK